MTVTANANVHSVTFSNNSTATGTITVNSGVTLAVTAGITSQNAATASTSALLQGDGTITCAGITVGGTITPSGSGSDFFATLTSTLSNLNSSGALTLKALYNSGQSAANQGTFALSSGIVTVPNVSFVTVPFFGPILTMVTGNQSGTLVLSNAAPFTFSGGGSSIFTPNGTNATVVYLGAGQTVDAATYNNLTLAGTGTKTLSGVTVDGVLSIQGSATGGTAPSYGSNAVLQYSGSARQTTGPELVSKVPNLMISNSNGVVLGSSITVSNLLTLASGQIITSGKSLIIDTNGSTSGGSSKSYVNGSLQKNFNVGTQTFSFPVGDTEFAPLVVSNLSVTAKGALSASTQAGLPSQITGSGINTNQLVNRTWVLTNLSGTFGSYGATFNYPADDLGTNTAPSEFVVGVLNGNNFSYATISGTPTTTSTSISGQSGFGTFAMGDAPSQAIQLSIASIDGGSSPQVGAPFTVTVQSQENGGTPNPVSQATTITLSLHSGSGVLGGTLVGTIPAWSNSVTITGVTYNVAQSGVRLTAAVTSGQSLSSANSSSFTVVPANQTITFPSPGNQTYGVAPITLTASASSGLPVTYSVTSGPATVSGNVLTITGAGSVTVQAAQAGDTDWNAATPVSQTISVASKTVTGSFTAKNKTYDGTTTATVATTGLSGVINSDVVNLTIGTLVFTDKNVGNGKTVIASGLGLSGTNAENYILASTSATNTANISTATLTVTANNTNRVYGAANPLFTASYSGFVNGENTSVLSGAPSVTSSATVSSVVGGPYAIRATQGTLGAANYTFNFVNGNLTVTPATLTVSADNQSRSYGTTNPVLTANYNGFVNGETTNVLGGSPALSTTAVSNSPPGAYTIQIAAGTLSATNYVFTFDNGTLTVHSLPLILTIQPVTDPTNAIVLSAPGIIPNITYQILGSTDLVNWAQIGTAQSGTDGSLFFTNSTSSPSEFYRTLGP